MTTFTDDQAKQQLDAVLRAASNQGEVHIKTQDGHVYAVRPVGTSPLDIAGVDTGLSSKEIIAFVREGRDR